MGEFESTLDRASTLDWDLSRYMGRLEYRGALSTWALSTLDRALSTLDQALSTLDRAAGGWA